MIVADTHTLVWLISGDERLGKRARTLLDSALGDEALSVSAISFWEVALLVERGRIDLGSRADLWRRQILDLGVNEIPIDGEIAITSVTLPSLHADPADRIILATAQQRSAALITADERLLAWRNPLRRHDARR